MGNFMSFISSRKKFRSTPNSSDFQPGMSELYANCLPDSARQMSKSTHWGLSKSLSRVICRLNSWFLYVVLEGTLLTGICDLSFKSLNPARKSNVSLKK